jgi:Tfp pilus assembly protein PilX
MTPTSRNDNSRRERGIVLIAAVLVVMLSSVLALGFMSTSVGERTMSSNVQVARASLYAADAGVRTAQQRLANIARVQLATLSATYTGTGPLITSPGTMFPTGNITGSATSPAFSTVTRVTFSDSSLGMLSQVFNYRYTIVSTGSSGALGTRKVQSQGILQVSASRGNFADFLLFTNIHTTPSNGAIWFTSSGYFDGRMHTNGRFRFAYQPTFTDLISSVATDAYFYNVGFPLLLNADRNGNIDVPNLNGGYTRGAANIPLPPNSYGQQNAALGRDPSNTTAPTNNEVRAAIGAVQNGNPPPTGIYLPNDNTTVPPTLTGGIYTQGNLDQCLVRVDSLGRQVYVMRQGAVTKTITVDRSTSQTLVYDGSTTTTYTGVPRGVLYTQGAMSDLRGPDRVSGNPQPGIADGNQLLIAASGDIVIQRDIVYHDYDEGGSVLGIYSSGGAVRVGTSAPNNCYLDAYVMATGASGAFQVDNYNSGSPRGTFHLRGGMVSTYYGLFYQFDVDGNLIHGYARDFHYDRRGLIPPYYPTTPRLNPNQPSAQTLAWKEL